MGQYCGSAAIFTERGAMTLQVVFVMNSASGKAFSQRMIS
jgi:hypothetical protein